MQQTHYEVYSIWIHFDELCCPALEEKFASWLETDSLEVISDQHTSSCKHPELELRHPKSSGTVQSSSLDLSNAHIIES